MYSPKIVQISNGVWNPEKVCILDAKTSKFSSNMFILWMALKILTKSQELEQLGYLDTKPLLVWFFDVSGSCAYTECLAKSMVIVLVDGWSH